MLIVLSDDDDDETSLIVLVTFSLNSNEISFVRGYVTNTIAIEVPERNEDFVEFYLKELRETMDFDETIQRRGSFVYVTFKSERECADFLGKEHKCGQDTLRV